MGRKRTEESDRSKEREEEASRANKVSRANKETDLGQSVVVDRMDGSTTMDVILKLAHLHVETLAH